MVCADNKLRTWHIAYTTERMDVISDGTGRSTVSNWKMHNTQDATHDLRGGSVLHGLGARLEQLREPAHSGVSDDGLQQRLEQRYTRRCPERG